MLTLLLLLPCSDPAVNARVAIAMAAAMKSPTPATPVAKRYGNCGDNGCKCRACGDYCSCQPGNRTDYCTEAGGDCPCSGTTDKEGWVWDEKKQVYWRWRKPAPTTPQYHATPFPYQSLPSTIGGFGNGSSGGCASGN